jgi:hypothetical protein
LETRLFIRLLAVVVHIHFLKFRVLGPRLGGVWGGPKKTRLFGGGLRILFLSVYNHAPPPIEEDIIITTTIMTVATAVIILYVLFFNMKRCVTVNIHPPFKKKNSASNFILAPFRLPPKGGSH